MTSGRSTTSTVCSFEPTLARGLGRMRRSWSAVLARARRWNAASTRSAIRSRSCAAGQHACSEGQRMSHRLLTDAEAAPPPESLLSAAGESSHSAPRRLLCSLVAASNRTSTRRAASSAGTEAQGCIFDCCARRRRTGPRVARVRTERLPARSDWWDARAKRPRTESDAPSGCTRATPRRGSRAA